MAANPLVNAKMWVVQDDPEAGASTPGFLRASPSIRRNGEDYRHYGT